MICSIIFVFFISTFASVKTEQNITQFHQVIVPPLFRFDRSFLIVLLRCSSSSFQFPEYTWYESPSTKMGSPKQCRFRLSRCVTVFRVTRLLVSIFIVLIHIPSLLPKWIYTISTIYYHHSQPSTSSLPCPLIRPTCLRVHLITTHDFYYLPAAPYCSAATLIST